MDYTSSLLNWQALQPNTPFNGTGPQLSFTGAPNSWQAPITSTAALASEPTFSQMLLGGKLTDGSVTTGMLSPLLDLAKTGFSGWLGLQNLDLAKDTLAFQKDAFSKQFENQRTLTNSELRDRQAARVAANPTAYQSVDEYMRQNGV